MQMDGEQFEAEASRKGGELCLFWSDGEVWIHCDEFGEDFQALEESVQFSLSSRALEQATDGEASKPSDFIEDVAFSVSSHECEPLSREHRGLVEEEDTPAKPDEEEEEVIDVVDDPILDLAQELYQYEEKAKQLQQERQDHGKPTSKFNIGDTVETTCPLIVRLDEPLASITLGQLPANSRLRVVKIGTIRTGRRLQVRAVGDTDFRYLKQCVGESEFWTTRTMRENQLGWVSVMTREGLDLLRVVHHAGEDFEKDAAARVFSQGTFADPPKLTARQRLAAVLAATAQQQTSDGANGVSDKQVKEMKLKERTARLALELP